MKNLLPMLVLVLALAGCAHTECVPEIRVQKPPVPPVIAPAERPDLTGLTPKEQVRGLYDYILVLEGKVKEALTALDAYRK